jgi:hypothetical protein
MALCFTASGAVVSSTPLAKEADRPYHPNYTHMVFRGWYDFGGGSMADMGHYSLWTVFNALKLGSPTSVEPMLSHDCVFKDGNVSSTPKNDYSFSYAGAVRFKFPAISLTWHEGRMRPPTPEEVEEDHKEFLPEQMMLWVTRARSWLDSTWTRRG